MSHESAERHRRRERRAVVRFLRTIETAYPRLLFGEGETVKALRWAAYEWADAIENKRHL